MRVGILAKGGTDWMGGVYYTSNLVRALNLLPAAERPEVDLLLSEGTDRSLFDHLAGSAEVCIVPAASPNLSQSATRNPALIELLTSRRVDVIYPCMRSLGADFPIPWLPWIPDLQHRLLPECFDSAELARRDMEYRRMADDARLVVFSSRSAIDDFDRAYPGYRERLRVLRFATIPLPEWTVPDPRACADRYNLPEKYLILPNQFWTHKNHRTAFEAVRPLRDRGASICLVCTGRAEDPRRPDHGPELRAFVEQHGLAGQIRILGLLPRLDQIQLVRAAAGVLQPSLFEGWSTVVEDARLLGQRILLSDLPVHREQNPPGAVFFDPHDSEALAACLARAWDDWSAGPSLDREHDALTCAVDRAAGFALDFLSIARELLSGRSSRGPRQP